MSRLVESRLLFTKVERFLIAKQRDPFVLMNKRNASHSENEEINPAEIGEFVEESERGHHYETLIRGLFQTESAQPDTQRKDPPTVQMKMR